MDEVDGIGGNADRGGLQELVKIIKQTHIPIICICNDSGSRKIITLKKYCMDLKFRKPQARDMVPRILQIAQNEGLSITYNAALKLCESTGGDMRQCLNLLQVWRTVDKKVSFDEVKDRMSAGSKDFARNAFNVASEIFRPVDINSKRWFDERMDNYFVDPDLMPLFTQSMYVNSRPQYAQNNIHRMQLMHQAADAISDGDLISNVMRSSMDFGMMPIHAALSTAIPGCLVAGGGVSPGFPVWLGKNSSRGKNYRLLKLLKTNMSRDIGGDITAFNLDYLPVLKMRLIKPLINDGRDGVDEVIDMLDNLGLTKDDWTTIGDMGANFSPELDVKHINSKVKAALTRNYNSGTHHLKVARDPSLFKPKKEKPLPVNEDEINEDGDEFKSDDDDDSKNNDIDNSMIKQKGAKKTKKGTKRKASKSKSKSNKTKKTKTTSKKTASKKTKKPSSTSAKKKKVAKKAKKKTTPTYDDDSDFSY